eukprot:6187225-Pleurochrysis_carterae.AAC.2
MPEDVSSEPGRSARSEGENSRNEYVICTVVAACGCRAAAPAAASVASGCRSCHTALRRRGDCALSESRRADHICLVMQQNGHLR